MKFVVFNGSPRGKNSNSGVIAGWVLEGAEKSAAIDTEVVYINKTKEHADAAKKVEDADILLLVFPLYTDSMPGIVKAFIEKLEPYRGALTDKKLGFVVHSGFPEACQSRPVEKYLLWLAKELGAAYMGTAISGNSEGIRLMPPAMTKKKHGLFNDLGRSIMAQGKFGEQTVKNLAATEKLSPVARLLYRFGAKTGLANLYWNSQLKKNKAYKDRFARPYA